MAKQTIYLNKRIYSALIVFVAMNMIFISGCRTSDSAKSKHESHAGKVDNQKKNRTDDTKSIKKQLNAQQFQLKKAQHDITRKFKKINKAKNKSQRMAVKEEMIAAEKNVQLISEKISVLRNRLAEISKKKEIDVLNKNTQGKIANNKPSSPTEKISESTPAQTDKTIPSLFTDNPNPNKVDPDTNSDNKPTSAEKSAPSIFSNISNSDEIFPASPAKETRDSVDKPATATLDQSVDMLTSNHDMDTANTSVLPIRIPKSTQRTLAKDEYSLPMDMTKDIENPSEQLEVKFNFDAESIVNVVQMFSLTLDFQYFIDTAVSGSVTMTIDTLMTRREAWELFEHILWISGSYASKHHGFINILPFTKMPQERRIFATHDPIPNVNVEIIKLFNTTPVDISNLIKPFITAGATVTAIQYLNSLLIIEAPPNMEKLKELITKLDVMGETDWPQISIQCNYVESKVILEELKQILPILGFSVTTSEKGDGHSIKILELPRLQILIAAAPTMEVLEELKRWVKILDNEESSEEERIFFYDVKYNNAEDLSDNVSIFFNSSNSKSSRSRSSSSTPTSTISGTDRPASSSRQKTTNQNRRTFSNNEKPATIFDVPVTILADGSHNRLVIRTTTRAYSMLEALLRRLDTPPLQVLIQATIAEITLTKDTEFGFIYAAEKSKGDGKSVGIEFSPGLPAAADRLIGIDFNKNVDATVNTATNLIAGEVLSQIQAVAGKNNTRILNSPQIIAISDEEATINVGDSIPIASRTETGDSNNDRNFTDVQYQDTGIILTVTPHITAKKLVTLDIRQEVSEAIETETSSINSPTIQTRVIETSMIIEDGKTILLGGMIRSRNQDKNRGFPIIKDIPLVGKLFSSIGKNRSRLELLLLITVHVIDTETDVDLLMTRYRAALKSIDEFNQKNESSGAEK